MTGRRWWPGPRWSPLSVAVVLLAVSNAWGQEELERMAMTRVRLTTDPTMATGCARIGQVNDDSVKDLRKKIVRAGGNTAVLSFGVADLSQIYAEVFRCDKFPAAAPASSLPPGIPPPPPGPPPPPPPGPAR